MTTPVVLITGALTGIGRATALAFAQEGAHLVVSGRREEEGEKLVAELRKLGPRPNSYAPTCVTKPKYEVWLTRPSRVSVAWMWPSTTPVPKALPAR